MANLEKQQAKFGSDIILSTKQWVIPLLVPFHWKCSCPNFVNARSEQNKAQRKLDFWELCHCSRHVPAPNPATQHRHLHAWSVNIVTVIK